MKPGFASGGEVEVPDLVGHKWPDAGVALEAVGLSGLGSGGGTVVAQDPKPGTRVPLGSTVTIRLRADTDTTEAEHQIAVSTIRSLRDDESARDSVRNLLNEIKNAVDSDATHIQLSIKVTAPTPTKDQIVASALEAGLNPTVTDL